MNTTNKPDRSLVSLFAGCGGSSLGYKQAGFDIKLAVEWDTKAADVYRRNFDETPMFVGDIADLTSEEALEITGLQPGELDVLDGSPPCQGFSTAGHRKFSDSRNRLFEEYVRMIDVFRPKMLVMENVSGLRKGKMKLMFAEMTIALKEAGYKVSCRELNAWWYGVPQDRRRLIWVGVREDMDMEPGHPDPTVKRPVSVREALGILYDANIKTGVRENCMCRPGGKHCAAQPRPIDGPSQTQNASFRLKIELADTDSEVDGLEEWNGGTKRRWRSSNKPSGTLPAIRPPRVIQLRNPDFENKWKDGDGVGPTLKSSQPPTISIDTNRYGKPQDNISADRPSSSLRASVKPSVIEQTTRVIGSYYFPGSTHPSSHGRDIEQPAEVIAAIRPPHFNDGQTVRYLTIEESKTLQGFPAWFELKENEYKFVGNSVCPPMAEALGRHLLRLLEG